MTIDLYLNNNDGIQGRFCSLGRPRFQYNWDLGGWEFMYSFRQDPMTSYYLIYFPDRDAVQCIGFEMGTYHLDVWRGYV